MVDKFNLTPEALRDGEQKLGAAAAAVRDQFAKLQAAVEAQASKGRAFEASKAVSLDLKNQADKFNALVNDLAERIGGAKLKYVANADAGARAISAITGDEATTAGRSFDRLTRS